jgi:hypothetical protein
MKKKRTNKPSLKTRLKDRYDLVRKLRLEQRDKERPFFERMESVFEAPLITRTDFWCNVCKRDCSGNGYRQVFLSTSRPKMPTAWFKGHCPLGHIVIRRITDKNTDPYYDLSFNLQRQRYDLKDDLLTPEDPRFRVLYPKQYEEWTKSLK